MIYERFLLHVGIFLLLIVQTFGDREGEAAEVNMEEENGAEDEGQGGQGAADGHQG